MKKQQSEKKLALNKTTITQLNRTQENNVHGGATSTPCTSTSPCIMKTIDVVECPHGTGTGSCPCTIMR